MNGTLLTLGSIGALAAGAVFRPTSDTGVEGSASRSRTIGGVVLLGAAATAVFLYAPKARAAVASPRSSTDTPTPTPAVARGSDTPSVQAPSAAAQPIPFVYGGPKSKRSVVMRVSKREGKTYSINANTDKAGLSYGVIQWTQRSGNLHDVLSHLQSRHPDRFTHYFGPRWRELLAYTKEGKRTMKTELSDGTSSSLLWKEPWYSRFLAAGKDPALAEAQWEYAEKYDQHMVAAEKAAQALGVRSERALAIFFDRAVQQGTGAAREIVQTVLSRWGGTRPSYHQTLIDFGRAAADRYRSSTQKSSSWLPAGNEYHYWSHGKDRYLAVWNRVNALLTDPSLSDEPLPSGP